MDAPLIDTDDQVVETTQLGVVKVLYVRNKHHNHESDNDYGIFHKNDSISNIHKYCQNLMSNQSQ